MSKLVLKTSIIALAGILLGLHNGNCGSTPLGNSVLGTSTSAGGANGVPSPSGPGIHPGFNVVSFRSAIDTGWRFGGIDWLSNGNMVVVNWGSDQSYVTTGNNSGTYYGDVQAAPNGKGPGFMAVITGTGGSSITAANINKIYTGLWEPLGVYVAHRATVNDSDTIYVTTKTGLMRFVGTGPYTNGVNPIKVVNTCHARRCVSDSVGPGLYKSFTAYPPQTYSGTGESTGTGRRWHHFVAGLVRDPAGYLYTGTVSQYENGTSVNQTQGRDRCALLKIDPKNGTQQVIAGGLRSPSGLVLGPEGEIFGTDIQGSYNPANKLVNYRPGRFYGMRCDPTNPYIGSVPESFPAVVLDQSASTATYNIANSPSEPLYLTSGVYAGQMLIGDVAFGGIQRVFLEKVNNEWQGAAFLFSGGFHAGVGRLKTGPDGSIYAGSQAGGNAQASGNWCWGGAGNPGALSADKVPAGSGGGCNSVYDFFKLVPKDTTVFELLAVRSRVNGFELQFTKKVGPSAGVASNYSVHTWVNTLSLLSYGAGNQAGGVSTVNLLEVKVAPDSTRVFLRVSAMPAASVAPVGNPNTSSGSGNARVVHITGTNIRSAAGDVPWGPPPSSGGSPSIVMAWYTLNYISGDTAFTPPTAIDPRLASPDLRSREFKVQRVGATLLVDLPFDQPSRIVLRDFQGRIRAQMNVSAGRQRLQIPLANLAKGGYVVQARAGGKVFSRPVALF